MPDSPQIAAAREALRVHDAWFKACGGVQPEAPEWLHLRHTLAALDAAHEQDELNRRSFGLAVRLGVPEVAPTWGEVMIALVERLTASARERDDARSERDACALDLARQQNLAVKISRIKAVRIDLGLGLSEAKATVENESAGAAEVRQSLTTRLAIAERDRDSALLRGAERMREAAAKVATDKAQWFATGPNRVTTYGMESTAEDIARSIESLSPESVVKAGAHNG